MKVFKMNDFDWVAANNEEEAKTFYEEFIERDEIEEDFVGEVSLTDTMLIPIGDLPLEEQKRVQKLGHFAGELCAYKSFEWVINNQNITKPCIIASTEA
jgi:hypothetical protein